MGKRAGPPRHGGRAFARAPARRAGPAPPRREPDEPLAHARAQVEGRRAVLEALRSGTDVRRVRLSDSAEPGAAVSAIVEEARAHRVPVERVAAAVLDAMSQTGHHQGVVADVRPAPPLSLEELLEHARASGAPPFLVVLDGVEDPQNVGAIARSAEAAGAHGLVLAERHAAGVSPGSLRASAGALLLLPVCTVRNIARSLEWLRAQDVWVAGADPQGGKPYFEASLTGPLALVIGGESRGLHRLVRDRCDFLVSVPLHGRVGSLNASAAAAVVLFEAARQRAPAPSPQRPLSNP